MKSPMLLLLSACCLSQAATVRTATVPYVDAATNATLQAANAYTDAHAGSGGGGSVVSVNGHTGVVHLAAADVGAVAKGDTVVLKDGDGYIDSFSLDIPNYPGNVTWGFDVSEYIEGGTAQTFASRSWVGGQLAGPAAAAAAATNATAQLSNTVNAWQTYWDGDDVRLTVTNYFGNADAPRLYLEQKMPADDDHADPWFKIVWDELTRLSPITSRLATVETELPQKADRAWGYYDSATGRYSPDGLLQISHERIQIADGLAYTKQIATGGDVWVLTATEPTTVTGVTSNGFFRIVDGDGNALLEIVKGDKRTVGATATNITVTADEVIIPYPVVSDDHPEVQWCPDLAAANWQPATVTWGGQSGNWIAHVARPAGSSAFFKASYETGGDTYIKHSVPCGLDRAYIGGRAYDITVDANGFLKVVQ